eukprot:Plantae.Rhodophyta-Hildenbrandia_rubra.ctg11378.p1 GENE.Plantae.Rhodophyta-Hildenbrandia_rubra.ctg11378~~Plantae.Rhodophyta-Hildenbrandia_rubra.ctg11378.p1  ORF type:complete len:346 (+),score=83.22 Plantae.Rhodophyta-Hildenbrandia_rubra.ctg11378:167-1204(+)
MEKDEEEYEETRDNTRLDEGEEPAEAEHSTPTLPNLEAHLAEQDLYESDDEAEDETPLLEQMIESSLQKEDLFATSDEDIGNDRTRNSQQRRPPHPFESIDEHTPLVPANAINDVRWASDLENDYYEPTVGVPDEYYESEQRARRAMYIIGASGIAVMSIVTVVIVSGLSALMTTSEAEKFRIVSDWRDGQAIPAKYGCLAGDRGPVSMPVRWNHVPRRTESIVILLHNPDAYRRNSKADPLHWFVLDIPVQKEGDLKYARNYISVNASYAGLLPKGAVERPNTGRKDGKYWAPCPQNRTKYVLYAFAVDAKPEIENFDDAREVINRFGGVPQSKLTGFYGPSTR